MTVSSIEQGEITLASDEPSAMSSSGASLRLSRGATIGRYVIVDRIGAGGMGIVYAAYDPELDRKVALKVLGAEAGDATARTRLLREAQALARLAHPNVVTIHDVGTHEERVWLAMEFVEGRTLDAWCKDTAPEWTDIVEVMLAVGRGVAAAHVAGLLHRDLKPTNVMIAHDGRVRVMDFGLAREHDEPRVAKPSTDHDTLQSSNALSLRMTRADSVLGTPGYMAPEQLHNHEIGPATDQFGFCVTFWEALFGERPFAGETMVELGVAVLEGKVRSPSRPTQVPRWLRRVLERGLSVQVERRWPSIEALLVAVERGRRHARRRRGIIALGFVGVALAGTLGWREVDRRARIEACETEGATIDEVWNDTIRTALRDGIAATPVAYSEWTAEHVMPWVDAYARGWQSVRTDVCVAGRVDEELAPDAFRRAIWCLDEGRNGLDATLRRLSRGGRGAVDQAVPVVATMPPAEVCRDPDRLRDVQLPPDDRYDEVVAIRELTLRCFALLQTGAFDEAMTEGQAALEQAEALGWTPLVARARQLVGVVHLRRAEFEAAERALQTAYFEASTSGASETAIAVGLELTYLVGVSLARHDEAFVWARHVESILDGRSDDETLARAGYLKALGNLHHLSGDQPQAKAALERGLAILEREVGPEHPHVALYLNDLANTTHALGDEDGALALYERALAIKEKALGPEHPQVATSLSNTARLLWARGDRAAATPRYERALAIQERAFGPDHPDVATSLVNLASVRTASDELAEAEEMYRRALAIRVSSLGPDHPDVAFALNSLAIVLRMRGTNAEVEPLLRRALAIQERASGPDDPGVAAILDNLAGAIAEAGRTTEARRMFERSLAIGEKHFGPEHPILGEALEGLAEVELHEEHPARAIAFAERSVTVREHSRGTQRAYSLFLLARALLESGSDRERALEIAARARAEYSNAGAAGTSELAELEAWLARNG